VVTAAVEESTATQAGAKPATEPEVEAESAVVAEVTAEAGSRGSLSTAKAAGFEFVFDRWKRNFDRPVREPEAGDDAQRDQR
jgi:hypothetical protein